MDKPTSLPAPPEGEKRSYSYERHDVTIEDPWHWLRDPKYPQVDDPGVLAYLNAENDYFDFWEKQQRELIDQLFEEMKGRIKEDDSSVPIRDGGYLYWWAFRPGAQYRTWYRKPVAGGEDEIIFDEPVEAEGKEYFRLGAVEPSPDGRLLATLVDDNGSERFQLRVRDLATGKDIETVTEVGIGQPEEWRTVIEGSDQVYLTGVTAYRDHLAISSRVDGLDQLVLRTYAGEETRIPFEEASYTAFFHGNPEFAPESYRLGYSSMVRPMTTYDYDPKTRQLE